MPTLFRVEFFNETSSSGLECWWISNHISFIGASSCPSVGSIDYDTGTVTITNFVPEAYTGESISIIAAPLNPNITPVRNQILLISQSEVNVIDDNTNLTLSTASNIETVGQTTTLLTPSIKLYNF